MIRRPAFPLFLAIAATSSGSLAYEVLLMRLFSIIQWHHFAYLIISLALLGYGVSGVFLAFNRERLIGIYGLAVTVNLLLFGIAAPACFLIAQQIPFNPAELLWAPEQFGYLSGLYLLLSLPFFFAANVIGLSFFRYRRDVSSIYAADLYGAGIGSLSIIALLFVLFPEKILPVIGGLSIVASLLVQSLFFRRWRTGVRFTVGAATVVAVFLLALQDWTLNISPYKGLSQQLRIPGTEVVENYSSPLGLLSVIESMQMPLRHAPGLSLNADAEPPEQLGVFTDADNLSAITRYDGNSVDLAYLDQSTSALPYHLQAQEKVLILGAGTGSDVLQALYHKISAIDAVELNPQTIALVKDKHADYAGHIYSDPRVRLHTAEARGFVATSRDRYDLINLSLLDAFGASSAGLYALAETYLYTEEALKAYLEHLTPGGYLSMTRWIKMPPRDTFKLLATASQALQALGDENPEQSIVLIRSWQTATVLIKNGAFFEAELAALRRFCDERGFDADYYPGVTETEVNRFNILQEPYYYQAATALLGEEREAFIAEYKFNIKPATDDLPYFFHFFKWRTLPEIWSLLGQGGMSLLESGYLLLIAGLVQAVAVSFLLIIVPLWFWKRKLGIETGSAMHWRIFFYFSCLGLAFLFVEIAFIQKFILILHHPLYAITVVVSTFLLSAGIGSRFSKKLSDKNNRLWIAMPIAAIVLLSAVYILEFQYITGFLLQRSELSKVLGSIALIAPLGFFMGMPFPMGMASLGRSVPALIPWAWGVNGCASVISAILAALIATEFGFTVLVFSALWLYALAALSFPAGANRTR
ncbi:MAG TPA: SAM-dependent methyltransferase [Methylococcaceae bacterium]|nr:SAM-dependent methyltransferase [Methylococcaceae bacterium]